MRFRKKYFVRLVVAAWSVALFVGLGTSNAQFSACGEQYNNIGPHDDYYWYQDECKVTPQPSETMLGYDVGLVHGGHKYGNGMSNVHDRWEAPALNCFALTNCRFCD